MAELTSEYQLCSPFFIRLAGAPFDLLDGVATPRTHALAAKLRTQRAELRARGVDAIEGLKAVDRKIPGLKSLRSALLSGQSIDPALAAEIDILKPYVALRNAVSAGEQEIARILNQEIAQAHQHLVQAGAEVIRRHLVLSSESANGALERAIRELPGAAKRDSHVRGLEQLLLLNLQRVAAKNETIGEFGPGSWATVDPRRRGVASAPEPGIQERSAFYETWVLREVVSAMNQDPAVRPEIRPRIHPYLRKSEQGWVNEQIGERIAVSEAEESILSKIDGNVPAHAIGSTTVLEALLERKMIIWELELPTDLAFETLRGFVGTWRQGPARSRWLETLQALDEIRADFERRTEPNARRALLKTAAERLSNLGVGPRATSRKLYAASNILSEECRRAAHFSLGGDLAEVIVQEGAPWFDLWRDAFCYVGGEIARGLREVLAKVQGPDGTAPLPAFLAHWEKLGPEWSLDALGSKAYSNILKTLASATAHRDPAAEEWILTEQECHAVRQQLTFDRFDEYTWPSADLQLEAASMEAINRGDYEIVLAELHPAHVLLQHAMYWGCPDLAALRRSMRRLMGSRPFCSYFMPDAFSAHVRFHFAEVFPEEWTYVAPTRPAPGWPAIPPAQAQVFIEKDTGDVGIRARDRRYLGSFARQWFPTSASHPFVPFTRLPHSPRVRVGRLIVQRRAWLIERKDLGDESFTGSDPRLFEAIQTLRAARGLPRYVFVRPPEQVLSRYGALIRDKDVKPILIDLESFLFVELLQKWFQKYGVLELTEMRPEPLRTPWVEPQGRYSFELRILVGPSEQTRV